MSYCQLSHIAFGGRGSARGVGRGAAAPSIIFKKLKKGENQEKEGKNEKIKKILTNDDKCSLQMGQN